MGLFEIDLVDVICVWACESLFCVCRHVSVCFVCMGMYVGVLYAWVFCVCINMWVGDLCMWSCRWVFCMCAHVCRCFVWVDILYV